MKNKLFIGFVFISLLISKPSFANWVKVSQNQSVKLFVNLNNISGSRDQKYVWVLMDERQPKESYKSRVAHMSIDCKIGRHKLLALFLYDDHMGKGKVLKEMQDLKRVWRSTKRESIAYTVLEKICDK